MQKCDSKAVAKQLNNWIQYLDIPDDVRRAGYQMLDKLLQGFIDDLESLNTNAASPKPIYCMHCATEIVYDHDEPDSDVNELGDEVVLDPIKMYVHVHSGKMFCEGGETGAFPMTEENAEWLKKRKQVQDDEDSERRINEAYEREQCQTYERDWDTEREG